MLEAQFMIIIYIYKGLDYNMHLDIDMTTFIFGFVGSAFYQYFAAHQETTV